MVTGCECTPDSLVLESYRSASVPSNCLCKKREGAVSPLVLFFIALKLAQMMQEVYQEVRQEVRQAGRQLVQVVGLGPVYGL